MNSQQELLDAIDALREKKDKSFDTPATVLRVEGDTVWVHIDGGADETPVLKTVNCSEGEIVQVRISNGSAFLVGNASAPPTDDTVAVEAQVVAVAAEEKADEAQSVAVDAQQTAGTARAMAISAYTLAETAETKANQNLNVVETWYLLSATAPTQPTEESHSGWSKTEPAWSASSTETLYYSIRTVTGSGTATWSTVGTVQSYADLQILKNAVISTVSNTYVAQGNSNITSLSSTMLQNANGVNVYNNTLAVGDSYAHIDGDSFDIKQVTTAGTIDDTNDTILAQFGAEETLITSEENNVTNCLKLSSDGAQIYSEGLGYKQGWTIDDDSIHYYGTGSIQWPTVLLDSQKLLIEAASGGGAMYPSKSQINRGSAEFEKEGQTSSLTYYGKKASINGDVVTLEYTDYGSTVKTVLSAENIQMTGNVQDLSGNNKTPTILESTTISASTTSYTFTDSAIKADSTIDIYDEIFGFAPTGVTTSTGSCTITFPAQSSTHKIKLHVY